MNLSVIGTGYVGLVTGACLAYLGHRVICVDAVSSRVDAISAGRTPFFEPGLADVVTSVIGSRQLTATVSLRDAVLATDITLIAVGTPDDNGHIDLSQIEAASAAIGEALKSKSSYHVVAVKSTVVPGTTDGVVKRALERASGKKIGDGIGLCMNPEFLREGTAVEDFMNPDRIIIGSSDDMAGGFFAGLYASFTCPVMQVSLRNAELTKYASNALLATLISFSNELAQLSEATPGADLETVMDGLHLDRRLSPIVGSERVRPGILSYLRPSSGYGGSCLPKDIAALRAFAREQRVATPLLNAVASVNDQRTSSVVEMAEARIGGFKGKRVGVLGLAFKSGTDDLRYSPAIGLVDRIMEKGGELSVYDPVATQLAKSIFRDKVTYAGDAMEALKGCDVAVIGTGWPEWHQLDWSRAKDVMRGNIVFDARNSLKGNALPSSFVHIRIGVGP